MSDLVSCPVCGDLPSTLTVNTGRDGAFPDAFHRLKSLEIRDVFRCPDCGALFEWQDFPQFYGSGNNAEESLTRLTPEAAFLFRRLLEDRIGADEASGLLDEAFTTVPPKTLTTLIVHLMYFRLDQFELLLGPLVDRFLRENSQELYSLLYAFTNGKPDRCRLMIRLLKDRALPSSAKYLLELCETESLPAHQSGLGGAEPKQTD
jgi:hypothetical protein